VAGLFFIMDHIEISIVCGEGLLRDQLVAELSDLGFQGFEETDELLKAYVDASQLNEEACKELCAEHGVGYTKSLIGETNWNDVWESGFQPLVVTDPQTGLPWAGVRASFHPPMTGVEQELLITPKMSFGTGHHATTYMMMQLMKELPLKGAQVLDFGTGTGILAILAEKLGAAKVTAADYDDWCIENTRENLQENRCCNIEVIKTDTCSFGRRFDILLANVNRNIILDQMTGIVDSVAAGTQVLLSGLLQEDEQEIVQLCTANGWKIVKTLLKDGWIALWFNV